MLLAAAGPSFSAQTFVVLKVIGGLVALTVLAYLGGHKRFVKFQHRLGISSAIAGGLPFIVLGLIAAHPTIGVLTPEVLERARPLMHFGLGWLGFIIGAQLDIRVLDRLPRGSAYIVLVEAMAPFAIVAVACGALMLWFGRYLDDPALWRDLLVLAAAAAMTAPRRFHGFANQAWREGKSVDILIAQLDEIVGVIGLLFVTAYFREPGASTWQLPGTAWIFVAGGLGMAVGVLMFAVVRVPQSNAEFLAVVLGSVAFASGLAGYLQLSPIVVCFIAGTLVVNFPNEQREQLYKILHHLERPLQLLFLIIVGAMWVVDDWRAWLLVPAFVLARIIGKAITGFGLRHQHAVEIPRGFVDDRHVIVPMSSLAIGLVISLESLYSDVALPWLITAVIGSAFLTEIMVQLSGGASPKVVASAALTGSVEPSASPGLLPRAATAPVAAAATTTASATADSGTALTRVSAPTLDPAPTTIPQLARIEDDEL